ncbi:Mechanosensitive ion channel protein 2, chloroplastic [Zostera marina]|uniref:Mechanosensitive ion channel protein 2, chloroplastic n=1 Tax=Zostera marina TaxID=29655 RepID=A0A0K9Q4X5_ZOSMR|nr:Mechanosensitive ion channel protein 2, chloroplastic [Zostera marina]
MMSVGDCLQISYEAGICFKKCSFGVRNQKNLRRVYLSPQAALRFQPRDLWSFIVSHRFKKTPIQIIRHRRDTVSCRSFRITLALMSRSYAAALRRHPILLTLISAVGLISFSLSACGLRPLLSRNFFTHNNDNWTDTKAHSVFISSYLQPLLIWAAVILICRSIDPVVLSVKESHVIKQRILNFIRSLTTVLTFGYSLSMFIHQMQNLRGQSNDASSLSMSLEFAAKSVNTCVWIASASLFVEMLGFSTHKLLTAGGLGTLLLTLVGREIFTNFLSSLMIYAGRPFILDEWIQTNIDGSDIVGSVERIGLWSPTIIRGENLEAIHVPNQKFNVNVVRNHSQKTHYRMKTHLAISQFDAGKISSIVGDMRKVLANYSQVEKQKLHRRVFFEYIDTETQAFMIQVSCFVKTSHYEEFLGVKESILLDLLRVIRHHRARLATPIRTVQRTYKKNQDRTHDGHAHMHRPIFLINNTTRLTNHPEHHHHVRIIQSNSNLF